MKDIIVTNEIKMKVIKYFGYQDCEEEKNFYLNDAPDSLFKFYHSCMENNLDVCDADRYANLNTVLGYDVGIENFQNIDGYLWGEKDFDLMELIGTDVCKEIIKDAVDALGINVDFDKWNDGEIKEYAYYV